jgi:D-alanyl-lipoteichoic acid acyltransferase DltB (MBOAT superfamily)
MSLTSLGFTVFTLVVLALATLLPRSARSFWLLLASYAFYATWGPTFVAVLGWLTVVNYLVAERLRDPSPDRRWLWTGIAIDVVTILALRQEPWLGTAGVVGLSFYGLQAISYLVDTYTGALRIRPTLVELALYLAWFPKLLAGPLERAGTFVASVRDAQPVEPDATTRGLGLIGLGIARKILLADRLYAAIPAGTFTAPATLPAGALAYGLVAAVFSLYNDFAGYSDIARGTSLLFGIPLSVNFAQPLLASSLPEFWSRWHASLSRWLRDYVYLPTSRAILRRRWDIRRAANLLVPPMAAMLVSGFWHGTRSGMMLWGGLQGFFLVAGRIASAGGRQRRPAERRWSLPGNLRVFSLVAVALVAAQAGLGGFVAFWSTLATEGTWPAPSAFLVMLLGASLLLDVVQRGSGDELVFLSWPRPVRAGLLALLVVGCALFASDLSTQPFIYQGF